MADAAEQSIRPANGGLDGQSQQHGGGGGVNHGGASGRLTKPMDHSPPGKAVSSVAEKGATSKARPCAASPSASPRAARITPAWVTMMAGPSAAMLLQGRGGARRDILKIFTIGRAVGGEPGAAERAEIRQGGEL